MRTSDFPSDAALNRRSFLEHAGLSAIGLAGLSVAHSHVGNAQSPSQVQLPYELGRGFLSTGQTTKALLADMRAALPERQPSPSVSFAQDFAVSRSSYAKLVSGSARAKFGSSVSGISGTAAASRDFRSERKKTHLVLAKRVTVEECFLRDPVLSAAAIAEKSPWAFAQRYGDELITRVTLGGQLIIVYDIECEREEDTRNVMAKLSGVFGGARGSASFHSAITSQSEITHLTLKGFCSGVKTVPQVIGGGNTGGIEIRTVAGETDPGVAELLRFWDEFEELVARDRTPVSVGFDTVPVQQIGRRIPRLDGATLRRMNAAIGESEVLDDLIDTRLADLRYLKDHCMAWNTHVQLPVLDSRIRMLENQARALHAWIAPLMDVHDATSPGDQFTPPFDASSIASIPDSWICRDLRLKWEKEWPPMRNMGFNDRVALPRLYRGQHIRVRGSVTKYGRDPARVQIELDTGTPIGTWNLVNNGQRVDVIVRVPEDASALVVKGVTFGGDPCVISLSIWG